MPTGDYVMCPACGNSMLWGMGVCPTCREKLHPSTNSFFQKPVMKPEPTLNEVADDFIGKEVKSKEFRGVMDDMDAMFQEVFGNPQANPITKPKNKYKETLVVNLFAGPGTGKSTTAAGIFFELKNRQVNCEIAAEYAKDLVWQKRNATFEDQIYLFAKQHHRIFNLLGQVDVVITDCPILLSPVYDVEKRPTFAKLVAEEHNRMWTYNVFLKRHKTYNPTGRLHNEQQAHQIDRAVLDVLDDNNQCYETFAATPEGKDMIVQQILLLLAYKKEPAPKMSNTQKVRISLPQKPYTQYLKEPSEIKRTGWWER